MRWSSKVSLEWELKKKNYLIDIHSVMPVTFEKCSNPWTSGVHMFIRTWVCMNF